MQQFDLIYEVDFLKKLKHSDEMCIVNADMLFRLGIKSIMKKIGVIRTILDRPKL